MASDQELKWLNEKMSSKFEIKFKSIGPEAHRDKELRILNRIIRWTSSGLEYEADQTHGEAVIADLGFENVKSVSTPGTNEHKDVARWRGSEGHRGIQIPFISSKVEFSRTRQERFAVPKQCNFQAHVTSNCRIMGTH